jgi:spoIIIJ-associated protein
MRKKLSIETEGKNAQEAINKALKQLNLPRNKVQIEILTEEKQGLFGMPGARQAKVRVTPIK